MMINAAKAPLIAAAEWLDSDFPYPDDHLDALVNVACRPALLQTGHTLWYVYATAELYFALANLDDVLEGFPLPVRTAVVDEVQAVGRDLKRPIGEQSRDPFGPVPPVSHRSLLRARDRNAFRNAMGGHYHLPLPDLADVVRLMVGAMRLSTNRHVSIDIEFWLMSVEVSSADGACIAQIAAALSDEESWTVEISRWSERDRASADLKRVLDCELPVAPALAEVVSFLDLATSQTAIESWADTALGRHLAGTRFLVTERH